MNPTRIVTLPPKGDAAWARRAREAGAQWLELRTDLHRDPTLARLAEVLPLLASERGAPAPSAWLEATNYIDRPLGAALTSGPCIASHHAAEPMCPKEAEALWPDLAPNVQVKHVEPLGGVVEGMRLLETQERLRRRFGDRVTVLAVGESAGPVRCLLASRNALDYLALDEEWRAATGQRLLADALRTGQAPVGAPRRGIIGHRIAGSESPRIHPAPFDRLDLPADAPIGPLLGALAPHYAGLAVTSPFKRAAACAVGAPDEAVNTLVNRQGRWEGVNTDVDGAARALELLGAGPVTVLGGGGAAYAVKQRALSERREVCILPRTLAAGKSVSGAAVWTWPPEVESPEGMRFERARVAVISYGPAAQRIARRIGELGGEPVLAGEAWFAAQARAQRDIWSTP